MRIGIFKRVFAIIVLLVFTMNAALGAIFYERTRAIALEELGERGRVLAESLSLVSSRGVETGNVFHTLQPLVKSAAFARDVVWVRITDSEGRVLVAMPENQVTSPAAALEERALLSGEPQLELLGDTLWAVSAVQSATSSRDGAPSTLNPEPRAAGASLGVVAVALSLRRHNRAMRVLGLLAVALVLLLLAASAIPGFLLSRWLASRVATLVEATRRLGSGEYEVRMPITSLDELGDLARGFNVMGQQLDAARSLLEQRVAERTAALQQTMHALEEKQGQVLQSEKMAAVGQLAAGLAHEINNPLGIILGFAQGLARRVPEGDPQRLPVTAILREATRCKDLVQELLTFSRTARKSVEVLDLNALVQSTGALLESRARTQDVRTHYELAPEGCSVAVNRTQLQQVVVNLGTNALDAMPVGGELWLRTRKTTAGFCLEVADSGTGMPEEVRLRIFEPFFTTKEVGKGTGLGLSIAHEIVQQHHGTIAVKSRPGEGTTFTVELPPAAESDLRSTSHTQRAS